MLGVCSTPAGGIRNRPYRPNGKECLRRSAPEALSSSGTLRRFPRSASVFCLHTATRLRRAGRRVRLHAYPHNGRLCVSGTVARRIERRTGRPPPVSLVAKLLKEFRNQYPVDGRRFILPLGTWRPVPVPHLLSSARSWEVKGPPARNFARAPSTPVIVSACAIGAKNDAPINATPAAIVQFLFITELLVEYPSRIYSPGVPAHERTALPTRTRRDRSNEGGDDSTAPKKKSGGLKVRRSYRCNSMQLVIVRTVVSARANVHADARTIVAVAVTAITIAAPGIVVAAIAAQLLAILPVQISALALLRTRAFDSGNRVRLRHRRDECHHQCGRRHCRPIPFHHCAHCVSPTVRLSRR